MVPSKVWSKLECFSTAFRAISSLSAEDYTVTVCVFPRRALKTPSAKDAMPTLTSTSMTCAATGSLLDGVFLLSLFWRLESLLAFFLSKSIEFFKR